MFFGKMFTNCLPTIKHFDNDYSIFQNYDQKDQPKSLFILPGTLAQMHCLP